MLASIRESRIKTSGTTLHVVEAGPEDGPLVVLLHGFPEFWYGWRKQIDYLADHGFRVVVPDQRGYNLSDKPNAVSAYGLNHLSKDVVDLIEALGRKKAMLVGHDWGGAVAWWTANRYPEHVERLCILNIPHHVVMQRNLRHNFRQLRKSWYIFFFQLPFLPEQALRAANFKMIAGSLLNTSRPGTFSSADMAEYQRAWSQPAAMRSMVNWYRAAVRKPAPRLPSPRITVPTLLIWGAGDKFLGREMAQPSIDFCDDGRLEIIEGATHWVQHEEPKRVNELMTDFFRNHV